MRGRIRTVFAKEVVDNFRDRRTLFSALLFGPLFGPVLFAVMISLTLDKAVSEAHEKLTLPVGGAEHAPNLVQFLAQNEVEIEPGPASLVEARSRVKSGELDLALVIPESFGESFREGLPATVQLVSDAANSRTTKYVARARALLRGYSHKLARLRLQVRGVSPGILDPLALEDVDVSTRAGRAVLLLGMMSYFVIFAMLLGGMYLAIDTTAGERERGSLEPLLTLPVRRSQLILGKILATCFYMLLSLAISITTFAVALKHVPLEQLGMSANLALPVAMKVFGVMLPFILLGAALLTVVASFTRSYKEAQSYLGVVLLVPTLPIIVAAIYTVKPTLELMAIPSLSQHLLLTALLKGEAIDPAFILVSAGSTLALGALLKWLAAVFYRREGILG